MITPAICLDFATHLLRLTTYRPAGSFMVGDEQAFTFQLEVLPEIREHITRCFPDHTFTEEDRISVIAYLIESKDDLGDICTVFECAHFIYHLVNGHLDGDDPHKH